MTAHAKPLPHASARRPSERQRRFPGWRWVAVAVAFPISGYVGWKVGGRVDAVGAALVGGAVTGAGLGAVQWWAADGAFGRPAAWIGASALGYAVGLAAGAALVGYDTDLGSLALMGLVSGAVLGAAQALALTRQGDTRLAAAWGAAMPVLFGLGWCASTGIGVNVDEQFTVFGAAGAVLFMLLSGLVLARFGAARTQVA
jgi:FtsH-binding integral membrane protein